MGKESLEGLHGGTGSRGIACINMERQVGHISELGQGVRERWEHKCIRLTVAEAVPGSRESSAAGPKRLMGYGQGWSWLAAVSKTLERTICPTRLWSNVQPPWHGQGYSRGTCLAIQRRERRMGNAQDRYVCTLVAKANGTYHVPRDFAIAGRRMGQVWGEGQASTRTERVRGHFTTDVGGRSPPSTANTTPTRHATTRQQQEASVWAGA